MEQLDSRDCEQNFIITGLLEKEAFDGAVNDQGKCGKVMEVIGAEDVSLELTLIGKPGNGRNRPILSKTPSKECRDKILENSRSFIPKDLREEGRTSCDQKGVEAAS